MTIDFPLIAWGNLTVQHSLTATLTTFYPNSAMASTAFDTGLPSIRHVQAFIRDQQTVEVKVTTGDTLVGSLIWQDANAICVKGTDGQDTILMRGAIAYIKAGR